MYGALNYGSAITSGKTTNIVLINFVFGQWKTPPYCLCLQLVLAAV